MKSETERTRLLCKEIDPKMNGQVLAIVASKMQAPGWMDRFISHRLWYGMLEFKNPRTKLSAIQKIRVGKMRRADPTSCYVARFKSDNEICLEDELGNSLETVRGDSWTELAHSLLHALHRRASDDPGLTTR